MAFCFIRFYLLKRERERENKQGEWQAEGEGEGDTDSPLSREPHAGLDPRSLRS